MTEEGTWGAWDDHVSGSFCLQHVLVFNKTLTCKSNYLVNLTQGQGESEPINRMEDIIKADFSFMVTSFRNLTVISGDLSWAQPSSPAYLRPLLINMITQLRAGISVRLN